MVCFKIQMQHAGTLLKLIGRQKSLIRAVEKHGLLAIGGGHRQIFSDNQLRIDGSLFVEKEEALHPNQIAFKSKLSDNLSSSKLNNISVDDIDKFMALSVSSEDLSMAHEMIEAFLSDKDLDLLHPNSKLELLHSFTCVSHILGCPKEAMLVWQQPNVRSMVAGSPSMETYLTVVIYLDLMLKHSMYKELLEIYAFFNDCQPDLINRPKAALLVVLALYKEGTTESLSQSLLLVHKMKQIAQTRMNHRMIIGPALLAYNLGQHSKTCAILQRFGNGNPHTASLLSQSLEMMALAKAGKLEQAVEVLREFLPRRAKRRGKDPEQPAR